MQSERPKIQVRQLSTKAFMTEFMNAFVVAVALDCTCTTIYINPTPPQFSTFSIFFIKISVFFTVNILLRSKLKLTLVGLCVGFQIARYFFFTFCTRLHQTAPNFFSDLKTPTNRIRARLFSRAHFPSSFFGLPSAVHLQFQFIIFRFLFDFLFLFCLLFIIQINFADVFGKLGCFFKSF